MDFIWRTANFFRDYQGSIAIARHHELGLSSQIENGVYEACNAARDISNL